MSGRKYIVDHYGGVRNKIRFTFMLDEEMYFWLNRLSQLDETNENISQHIRTALFMYLKHRLPNHFKMEKDYFMDSNERTGKVYDGERY